MFHSEIDITLLNSKEKYDFIMSDVRDLALSKPNKNQISDAIVVLGAVPKTLYFRVIKAAELYALGYSKKILITGARGFARPNLIHRKDEFISTLKEMFKSSSINELTGEELYNLTEAELGYKMLMELPEIKKIIGDLPPVNDILLEKKACTTIGNAYNSLVLLMENNIPTKRLIIVTSSYHEKRSILTFEKIMEATEFIAGPTTLDLKDREIESIEEMAEHKFYQKQFHCETDAIINYTRQGSLPDKMANMTFEYEGKIELEA